MLLQPPAGGKAAVVTTIHINTFMATATGGAESLGIFRSSTSNCASGHANERRIEDFTPAGLGETNLQYDLPGGLAVPAGKALCLQNFDPTNVRFEVSARGYAVPATAVPTS